MKPLSVILSSIYLLNNLLLTIKAPFPHFKDLKKNLRGLHYEKGLFKILLVLELKELLVKGLK